MFQNQTEVSSARNGKVAYAIRVNDVARETSDRAVPAHFLRGGTVAATPQGEVQLIRTDSSETKIAHQIGREKAAPNSLPGTVKNYDDVSVVCSLDLQKRQIEVRMPRALFPAELKAGMPFAVAFGNKDGLRRPIVSVRAPERKKMEAFKAEISSILEQL